MRGTNGNRAALQAPQVGRRSVAFRAINRFFARQLRHSIKIVRSAADTKRSFMYWFKAL
jgi:hypothetical protein